MKTTAIKLIAFLTLIVLFIGARALSFPNERGAASDLSAGQLFSTYCATCHGRDGRASSSRARARHVRNLSDARWQYDVSDERIFNSINNGRGKMPAFSKKLTEAQVDSLVSYVRGLKK